jgi:DNA-binding FadR family transcriptional regulator
VARTYESIVERYVERIVDGVVAPGEPLPREQDLAEEFAVSRGVAREAIRALQDRGLIQVTHGRGQRVADPDEWQVMRPDVLASMLARRDGRTVLAELIECRAICEPYAASLAALRDEREARDALVARREQLERAYARTRRPSERAEARAAERELHHAILILAGNRALTQMLMPVLDACERAGDRIQLRAAALGEQLAVADAVLAKDGDAAHAAMVAHLEAVAASLTRRR